VAVIGPVIIYYWVFWIFIPLGGGFGGGNFLSLTPLVGKLLPFAHSPFNLEVF